MKKISSKKQPKENPVSKHPERKISIKTSFPNVGIGASAGVSVALDRFFGNGLKNSGKTFVVNQHPDLNHVGIMPEPLQRITKMKVFEGTKLNAVMEILKKHNLYNP